VEYAHSATDYGNREWQEGETPRAVRSVYSCVPRP